VPPSALSPPTQIPPPTQVLTLVFLAWLAGTAALGALTRLWGEVQQGHFKVVWLATAGIGVAAGFGYRPAWAVAAGSIVTFAAIYTRRDREAGVLTAVGSLVVCGLGAPLYAFAVAGMLGAVSNAMLLGHWHLNQPKLGIKPIARLVWVLWIALAAFIVATAVLLTGGPHQGVRQLGCVTAIAFAGLAAGLTAMVHHLVRTRSIMSATGVLYLEILLAFVAAFTGSLAALAG
jgi:hypothetical protein